MEVPCADWGCAAAATDDDDAPAPRELLLFFVVVGRVGRAFATLRESFLPFLSTTLPPPLLPSESVADEA
jgi:hypothetical protein